MVPTTPKVVIEEFGGGPDHPESGDRGVWRWSRPPLNWVARSCGCCLEIFFEDLGLLLERAAALAQGLVAAHIVRRP